MNASTRQSPLHPFRTAVWRGLGVVAPPLLTLVIFLWTGGIIKQYALDPVTYVARELIVLSLPPIRENLVDLDASTPQIETADGLYARVGDNQFVPLEFDHTVRTVVGSKDMPGTAQELYRTYTEIRYLKPWFVIPIFSCAFILVLYLLGKFLAIGIGRFFWELFEGLVVRVPFVRSVYTSVKQVTDLMFEEHELEYTRIVAVEFPCKGVWSIGFVTGESLLDLRAAANEPVLAVLVPYSPIPHTGATITVLKSEAIDLNLTMDQALQFIISCGVVVPPHQMAAKPDKLLAKSTSNGAKRSSGNGQKTEPPESSVDPGSMELRQPE